MGSTAALIAIAVGLVGISISSWRQGSKAGKLAEQVANIEESTARRLQDLEHHVYEHDRWHLGNIRSQRPNQ